MGDEELKYFYHWFDGGDHYISLDALHWYDLEIVRDMALKHGNSLVDEMSDLLVLVGASLDKSVRPANAAEEVG